jgi:signal transduction histidine kinase
VHLQRQADAGLARRSASAILVYPAFLLVLYACTSCYQDHPGVFLRVAVLTVLCNAVRIPLSRRLPSLPDSRLPEWRRLFTAIILTNGLLWGLFLAWTLYIYGYSRMPASILLVSVAGAAAGSVAAHGSHLRVVCAYVASLLVPSMIVHLGLIGGEAGTGMFVIFLLYLGFLLEQARRFNSMYWKMLIDDDQLRARTAELEQAREAAEQASRAKSAFLANITHELRTPLNAIIGYTEMLIEDADASPDDPRGAARGDLGRILHAAEHQLKLVSDLLDFSKIEAGRLRFEVASYDFLAMAANVAETVRPLAARKNNALEVEFPPAMDPVAGDELRTSQSLYNLLSNACKFTENGVVRLAVHELDLGGRPWIECRVSDTGIGIASEQLGQLFQPFHQADNSTSRRFGGTGLGLALTREICTGMGGTVEVESEPGRGSTFTIRLPAHVAAAPCATEPQ